MTTALPPDIAAQVAPVQALLAQHLGEQLCAIHLYGSAVDGGLKPASDIDLMVTVRSRLPEATQRGLMRALLDHSAPPGSAATRRPLEVTVLALSEVVPWRYPARREMQFGEWLRQDIAAGRFEPAMHDHDIAILVSKLRLHSISLLGPPAAEVFERVPPADFRQALLDTIAQWNAQPDWQGEEGNVLLALARIWFSACTGCIVPKEAAAAWAAERLPAEPRALMEDAASAYLRGAQDALAPMPERMARTVHACKREIERALQETGAA